MTVNQMKLGLQRRIKRKSYDDDDDDVVLFLSRAYNVILEMRNCGMMTYDESEEMKHFIITLQRNYVIK